MSVGPSTYLANALMDTYLRGTSFTVGTIYIKLHLGDPGASGTANPAVETDRVAASFGAPSGAIQTTDTDTTWTAVAATEDYTHWSAWDAASGGNFLHSGTLESGGGEILADYTIPAGAITIYFIGLAA